MSPTRYTPNVGAALRGSHKHRPTVPTAQASAVQRSAASMAYDVRFASAIKPAPATMARHKMDSTAARRWKPTASRHVSDRAEPDSRFSDGAIDNRSTSNDTIAGTSQ